MSGEKHIILVGEQAKEHLGDRELIHLTNRVNEIDCDDFVGEERHATAIAIDRLLASAPPAERRKAVRDLDPAYYPIEHMKKLRERGDVAVAKDGEKTVGMVGFEHCRMDPATGRNVYEIRRIGVRKDHEGRGIGSDLHRAMFEKVRSADPTAILLVDTKNPRIAAQCRKMGYRPCTMEEWRSLKYGDSLGYVDEESTFWIFDR